MNILIRLVLKYNCPLYGSQGVWEEECTQIILIKWGEREKYWINKL